MGFTYVTVKIHNPANTDKGEEIRVLVDSGAMFTSIPEGILANLGIKPRERRRLRAFGGQVLERSVGPAEIEYEGHRAGITVIFGQIQDTPILGVTALESLGYELDPVTRKLKPVELLMI